MHISSTLYLIGLTGQNALAASSWGQNQRRQDGPVDPRTASDCTYFETALDKLYDCKYYQNRWSLSAADVLDWVSHAHPQSLPSPLRTAGLSEPSSEPKPKGRLLRHQDRELVLRRSQQRPPPAHQAPATASGGAAELRAAEPDASQVGGDECGSLWLGYSVCVGP